MVAVSFEPKTFLILCILFFGSSFVFGSAHDLGRVHTNGGFGKQDHQMAVA